jgi:hypothetical protein
MAIVLLNHKAAMRCKSYSEKLLTSELFVICRFFRHFDHFFK